MDSHNFQRNLTHDIFSHHSRRLFYLADEFNKEANSLLFLCLLAITFLAFILFVLITIAVALFNRRFMFDRLSGASYESTIQAKQEK